MVHNLLFSCKGLALLCILLTSNEETQLIIVISNKAADLVTGAPKPNTFGCYG